VVRSVCGDQMNPSISSFKRGNFMLGELSRISMLMMLFCMICDELGSELSFYI